MWARNDHTSCWSSQTRPTPCSAASTTWTTASPAKLANSTPHDRAGGRFAGAHERQRINVDVIQQFIDAAPDRQLKFVVSEDADVDEARRLLDRLHGWQPSDVLLMPEGTTATDLDARSAWLAEVCKRHSFRYCPRLHIALFGNTRGT